MNELRASCTPFGLFIFVVVKENENEERREGKKMVLIYQLFFTNKFISTMKVWLSSLILEETNIVAFSIQTNYSKELH